MVDDGARDLYDAKTGVIKRFSALALVVLIVLPFTAPFAPIDLRTGDAAPASRICDTSWVPVPVDTQNETPSFDVAAAFPAPPAMFSLSVDRLAAPAQIPPHLSTAAAVLRV